MPPELDELHEKVEGAIKACMISNAMDVPANVAKVRPYLASI